MTTTDTPPLQELLKAFCASDLGDGDVHQGINTLSVMAISLANLAPDTGSVLDPKGRETRLGTNLFITGAASAGSVSDEITTKIGLCQRNLHIALQRYQDWIRREQGNRKVSSLPLGEVTTGAENILANIFQGDGPLFGTETQQWEQILTLDSTECFPDFVKTPNFFFVASNPQSLAHKVTALRPGHPLIHIGLSHPSDFANFSEHGTALIEGRFTSQKGESAKCNLLMTDPLELLRESAKAPHQRTAWLKQFLWLSDGNAGPDVSSLAPAHGDSSSIRTRYNFALNRVLAERLSRKREDQMSIVFDTRASVIRFRAFLKQMEPQLPGIIGACRNLVNSLAFGLGEMAQINKQFSVSPEAVEELAMLLVRRMANTRSTMLHDGALKQRQALIRRVFNKLAKGAYNTRTIYKDLTIRADECRSCLTWLEDSELIYESNGKWHLANNAELSFSNSLQPLLEV
ncbi:MAG: hypothetical protein L7V87_10945 [Verrucomicrobiales bacterium]|jgi:hypothetical protein|nr:hypothetical protein [Verrucomicrobiales bacterium]